MKFRFVLLGPEDEPNEQATSQKTPAEGPPTQSRTLRYQRRDAGMVRLVQLQNGPIKSTPLTNFTARIVRDITIDDGEQQGREFGLEAELEGQRIALTIREAEFGRMSWVLNRLGPKAIIYPGQQQHARAAIQWLSSEIRQERIFAHLGWRKEGQRWIYLYAGGAVGSEGAVSGAHVHLPRTLQAYQTPVPKDSGATMQAVRASLRCLSVAPDSISFPLLASVYRAPFGRLDFSVFLTGKSGVFKTALAVICQQHFGRSMDASRLPANFASTGNALESLAFQAKDALLVVDDYAPTGSQGDGELHSIAERLFRAAGNTQGRSRLSGNGRVSAPQPPRCLLLATGEEVPPGQSIRARLVVVRMATGEVGRETLSQCQRAGQDGLLAESMGAFLSWIASHYEERQQRLQARVLEIRHCGYGRVVHARLPGALANLQAGWELFLEFALEVGAVSLAEREELVERSKSAFLMLATLQTQYQAGDPAARFLALLEAALACGRGHVADRQGRAPEKAALWGWQRKAGGGAWVPRGIRIGWVMGGDLFLEPGASYQVAQEQAGSERLSLGEQALRQELRERGLLASVDEGRKMVQVRRTLESRPRQVLHIKAGALVQLEPDSA